MKDLLAKTFFLLVDILCIVLSIYLAVTFREALPNLQTHNISLYQYLTLYPIYLIPLALFFYEGIYTARYDFWHETRLILKSLFFSAILIFAYLGMTKAMDTYSRLVVLLAFGIMAIMIPLTKNFSKRVLYKLKYWQKRALVYGNDPFLMKEIFSNTYLGYVEVSAKGNPATVFVNSHENALPDLKNIIAEQIKENHEVIFIPVMDDYDLTHSHIYNLSNTHTNLIVYENRLKSPMRTYFKTVSDLLFSLLLLPFLIPVMTLIALKIKLSNPSEGIIFKQKRLGKEGQQFSCYKFQTMYEDGGKLLQPYLQNNPDEVTYYNQYHKYKNDPRITPYGHFLRKTSLDELPQIFNIFKGEMSFIGPRPYLPKEREKMGHKVKTILSVKPGITGLWQVSGRNDISFLGRVKLDLWYIRNWNLWMDLMILIKTIKTVLIREGAH